jgi:cytoskeletal protein CcmA (bactofilin family)
MFNKTSNPFARPQSPTPAGEPIRAASTGNTQPAQAVAPRVAQPAAGAPQAAASRTAVEASPEPARTMAAVDSGSRLIVGPDVKLKSAEILDCDTLVVEGRVEATMDSRVIRIAENGLYSGTVSIDIAEIHGHFEGELTARSQLLIHSTGKVSGKVRYGKMLIEEGGQISGEIRSLAEEEPAALRPRPEILASVKTAAG